MSSKEYDTLQPILSQAERDLSFLDASMEVTDLSNTKLQKTTKKLRKRPWFGYKMNFLGRFLQILTITLIAIAGFIAGLSVLGIPLRTSNIYLLFRYGYTSENTGIQLIKYDGTLMNGPHDQYFFKVSGLVYNFENEFLPHRDFTLKLFTQDKELLDQFQFTCCKTDFYPRKITRIEETFPISSNQIGYFELLSVVR